MERLGHLCLVSYGLTPPWLLQHLQVLAGATAFKSLCQLIVTIWLLGHLGLVGHLLLLALDRLLVGEEVAREEARRALRLDGLEVDVELVYERNTGGDLEAGDLVVLRG